MSPATSLNTRSSRPWRFEARKVTGWLPAAGVRPVMMPVCGSSVSPAGRPSAAKAIGRSPVHGMRYRNGFPGRAP